MAAVQEYKSKRMSLMEFMSFLHEIKRPADSRRLTKSDIRRVWTSMFDSDIPGKDRAQFSLFLKEEFRRRTELFRDESEFRSATGRPTKKYPEIESTNIAKLRELPDNILIVPIMVSGFNAGALAAARMSMLSKPYELAFTGCTAYSENVFTNGQRMEQGKIYMTSEDSAVIQTNASKSVLIVDNNIYAGKTLDHVIKQMFILGIRSINYVTERGLMTPSTSINQYGKPSLYEKLLYHMGPILRHFNSSPSVI